MVGTATKGQDQREEDDSNDGDDLERREPELEFTEKSDAEVVDDDDDDEEDGDKDTWIDSISIDPVLDD